MRGFSPRELRRLMKRLGLEMKPLEGALRAIIETEDKNYVIENPQVLVMSLRGGETVVQIMGKITVEEKPKEKVEISEEDIELVMSQTGVSREEAIKALEEAEGDIAAAILLIQARKEG